MNQSVRRGHRGTPALTGLALAGVLFAGFGAGGLPQAAAAAPAAVAGSVGDRAPRESGMRDVQKQIALYTAMRELWTDHMQWTYATVDAYFHNPRALQPTLDRLLRNQKDIGAAIVPFYGQAAGDRLADLLTVHIQEAVPVLKAAQDGNKAALAKALADWYANAQQIADFLSSANPHNWPTSVTEALLKTHITQTTVYSVDLLKGDYKQAITDYGKAFDHMMMLSDTLSQGLIAQFPNKFCQ